MEGKLQPKPHGNGNMHDSLVEAAGFSGHFTPSGAELFCTFLLEYSEEYRIIAVLPTPTCNASVNTNGWFGLPVVQVNRRTVFFPVFFSGNRLTDVKRRKKTRFV